MMALRVISRMCFVCSLLLSTTSVAGIKSPVNDFLSSELRVEDKLIVFSVDLNEDGKNEVFISTDAEGRSNAKEGRIWDLYVSTKNGYVKVLTKGGRPPIFKAPESLVRLTNGKLGIVNYQASSSGSGSLGAYYLGGDNLLELLDLGVVVSSPGKFREKYLEVLKPKIIETDVSVVKVERFNLVDVYSENEVSQLASRFDDFESKYTYGRSDSKDPMRFPVLRKSDGALVGYKKYGVFTPIEKTDTQTGNSTDGEVKGGVADVVKERVLKVDDVGLSPSPIELKSNGGGRGKMVGGFLAIAIGLIFLFWFFLKRIRR